MVSSMQVLLWVTLCTLVLSPGSLLINGRREPSIVSRSQTKRAWGTRVYVPLVQELVTSCQLCCKLRFPVNIDIIRSLGQSLGRPLPTNICQRECGKEEQQFGTEFLDLGENLQEGFFSSAFLGLFCRDVELLSSWDGAATSAIGQLPQLERTQYAITSFPPKIDHFVIYIPQGTYPQHMAHEAIIRYLLLSYGGFTVSEQERPVAVWDSALQVPAQGIAGCTAGIRPLHALHRERFFHWTWYYSRSRVVPIIGDVFTCVCVVYVHMRSGWVDPGCKGRVLVARATVPSIISWLSSCRKFMYQLQHKDETATCKIRVCCYPNEDISAASNFVWSDPSLGSGHPKLSCWIKCSFMNIWSFGCNFFLPSKNVCCLKFI